MSITMPVDEEWNQIPGSLAESLYFDHVMLAVGVALEAGEKIRRYCETVGCATSALESNIGSHNDLGIVLKGSVDDFCTRVDIENEELIIAGIQQRFPEHYIIGEESVGSTGEIPPLTNNPTWVIDPIDGTTNFVSGLPFCCVSIAFCVNKQPVMGVVLAPMLRELYIAVTGHGAFRNGKRLLNRHVDSSPTASVSPSEGSRTPDNAAPITRLREAVVCFEFGYVREAADVEKIVAAVSRLMIHGCRTSRQLGSGALDLCYVACGRLDAVYAGIAGEGWKPWDYAAGCVLVRETGAVIETLSGDEPFDIFSQTVLCTTSSQLSSELRSVILNRSG
jgi:myo-inositol-1(or 4)-monophosphatase